MISTLSEIFTLRPRTRVSVLCIVAEISAAKLTEKNNDLCCCGRLLSPESDPRSDVEITFFYRLKSETPKIREPGDVVYLRNAEVQDRHNDYFLKMDLKKGDAGYCFFESVSDTHLPYFSHHGVSYDDVEALDSMRSFGRMWNERHGRYYQTSREDSFEVLEPEQTVDLACRILAANEIHAPKILWAWDGFDIKPQHARQKDSCKATNFGGDLGDEVYRQQPVEAEVEDGFPELGTMLPVVIFGEEKLVDRPSGWVKLRYVKTLRIKGQLIIIYTNESRWVSVSPMRDLVNAYETRLQNKQISRFFTPQSCVSRVYEAKEIDLVSLRRVYLFYYQTLQQRVNVEKEFCCCVFISNCVPPVAQFSEACHLHDQQNDEWRFGIKLLLEDPTGQLWATVYGQDAEFFMRIKSQVFHTEHEVTHAVKSRLEELMKKDHPLPWLEVCLRVVYKDGLHMIQLFNTTLNKSFARLN